MIAPTVAKRIVPELLGAGCSLLELKLEGIQVGKYDVSINTDTRSITYLLPAYQASECTVVSQRAVPRHSVGCYRS